jgi:hypothetical protein
MKKNTKQEAIRKPGIRKLSADELRAVHGGTGNGAGNAGAQARGKYYYY